MSHESIVHTHRVTGEELAIRWLDSLRPIEADVFFDRAKERGECFFRKSGIHYEMERSAEGVYVIERIG